MSITIAALFGIDYDTLIMLSVVIAVVWTAFAMIAVVFFAWAPYVSEAWRVEFGADAESPATDETE